MFLSIFQNTFCFPRTNTCNFFKLFFRSCIYLNFSLSFETAATSCTCSFYSVRKESFGLVPFVLNLPSSYLPQAKPPAFSIASLTRSPSFISYTPFNNSPFHINYNYFFCCFVSDIFGLLFFSISFS